MDELDSLLQVFKEIDNNLKNSMIKNRINLYNKDFDYEKLVKIIKEYIENFNILRETSEDELINDIKKKATNILSSTKEEYFNVHSFTNDAISLIEKVPHANINLKILKKSPMLIGAEIENKFYLYLLERNYQQEYILRNVRSRVSEQIRAEYDFVIQDIQKNIIAYIEVKVAKNKQILSNVVNQVRQKLYHDKNIAFYLVVYLSDTQKFIYILLDGEKEINLNEFPSYDELINNSPYQTLVKHTNWNNFVNSVDFQKLANIQKHKKDLNYEEGEKVRVFLNQYAISLQEKVPELKSYKWKLNQASTQIQWTDDNGFRLSFYKGDSLPTSTQINITFWASWYGGIFIKDNKNLIFSRPEIIDDLKKEYPNMEFAKDKQHVMAIHFKNGMPKENEVIVAIQQLLAILENIKSLNGSKSIESEVSTENGKNIAIPLQIAIKKKSEMQSVLGVEAVANTLSSVIVKEFDDSGMMIGIFGKWGRGKTHFSHRLWVSIEEKKSNYIRVSFSAWKYQDTKASWAYLYENIFAAYLDDLRNENTYIKKLKKWTTNNTWHKLVDNLDNFYIEKKKIFKGPFRILCQSGKITNTQGHRYEDRNRRRAICSRY
ncbi:P-loop NTPase fold protein [Sulfurospirillum multivorans]|uniref:KAP NTPase domain-containing protein n=2 Tax=Sulfurospirillum multivorans TaxID=66821 RepID=A0AA86ALI4_SULMK|nr:P-loop NTPase fold protein [Sulfurospirillum multivorans]AHJ11713.1 hypothetical protein SMUL_0432 [Sulfurospirillum multivorans DSM 12446]QEH05219.1 hypothetical protein SMN_0431 [Sulfurospirillum multivorans]